MEDKINNAVEKAENIAGENLPSGKERIVSAKKQEKARVKKERHLEKDKARLERLRRREHLKGERQKAKATAVRERALIKEKVAESKRQRREERAERKRIIKAETPKERSFRKRAQREKRREERKNGNHGGFIAAIITLSIATLVLASALTVTFLMPSTGDGLLESTYQKSFFDTVEQVDNIDLNLSKVLASRDNGAMQKYLVDTAINSELAENDLQQLPLSDESKFYTTKLINQIGDFAKYLNNKLIDGESLTEQDYLSLKQLYKGNLELKDALQKTIGEMGADYSFSSMIDGGAGNVVISNFNDLQNLSVEYPELIYDGPFSDGQAEREIKGLKGSEISMEDAKANFKKIFKRYLLKSVLSVGETESSIACYNFQAEVNGDILYAQISKKGGELITFSYAGSCRSTEIEQETAVKKAEEFLKNIGIDGVMPVWINLSNNVYTINFASTKNDVIIYADLIKVRVCAETAMVIGIEAKSYFTNHVDRNIDAPKISENTAKENLSADIEIESIRLALVPIGLKSEKLCYEFSGEIDGATYYVYIDATNGKQVEMFKVIESSDGTLLM